MSSALGPPLARRGIVRGFVTVTVVAQQPALGGTPTYLYPGAALTLVGATWSKALVAPAGSGDHSGGRTIIWGSDTMGERIAPTDGFITRRRATPRCFRVGIICFRTWYTFQSPAPLIEHLLLSRLQTPLQTEMPTQQRLPTPPALARARPPRNRSVSPPSSLPPWLGGVLGCP